MLYSKKDILIYSILLIPVIILFCLLFKFMPTCEVDMYDCSDFNNYKDANIAYKQCNIDINKLDKDKDGIPCEKLIR